MSNSNCMKSWSLKSIFVYQSSTQKPQWEEGSRSQHVYLIALFYIHIHVRPLPGWCVVKKPKVLIPTHYSSLVNPNCSCWWADRKKTDGEKLPSCILSSHPLCWKCCWDICQTLLHSCSLLSCIFDLSYPYIKARFGEGSIYCIYREYRIGGWKNKYVQSHRL